MRFPLLLVGVGAVALVFAWVLWPERDSTPGPDHGAVAEPGTAGPELSADPGARLPVGDEVDIEPHVGLVRIRTLDEDAAALPGCRVVVGEADARLSDADGKVEIALPPGRHWLEVTPATGAHEPVRQRLTAVGGRRIDVAVTLRALVRPEFWCRVVAAENQQPLAQARLLAATSNGDDAESGADGLLRAPADAPPFLQVTAPGRAPRRVVPVAGHATRQAALTVPLEVAAALRLSIEGPNGQPVDQAAVSLTAMPWSLVFPADAPPAGGPELWTESTAADGGCAFAILPPRCPLFVHVSAAMAAPLQTTLELQPGPNERRLRLLPLGEVRGRVLDISGRPIGGAQVVAWPAPVGVSELPAEAAGEAVTTGDDGAFQLVELQPGDWLLGLQHTSGLAAVPRRITVAAGASVQADIRAEIAQAIRGRLIGPGNLPISAFEVHALRRGIVVATAVTETDGSYVLEPLLPGEYEVFTELYESELAMAEPVRAAAGRSNVEIRVVNVLGRLRGIVQASRPGEVVLRGQRRSGTETCGGRTDADGRFEFDRVREGVWDLAATDDRGHVGLLQGIEVKAARSTPDQVLVLRPGAVLRPLHPTADAFRVEHGGGVAAAGELERGLPGEACVPPGDWTVVFLRQGFAVAQRDVTVAAGEQMLVSTP